MKQTLVALGLLLVGSSAMGQILKEEPPLGALREGQTVMVDDGSCPKGQVKLVVGGNHKKVGGFKEIVRTHSCVARPQ